MASSNRTTRYEVGRHTPERWNEWNSNLRRIASHPKNVVAANNLYDAAYIKHFTGIDALVLPSFCGYANAESGGYNPVRPEVGSFVDALR